MDLVAKHATKTRKNGDFLHNINFQSKSYFSQRLMMGVFVKYLKMAKINDSTDNHTLFRGSLSQSERLRAGWGDPSPSGEAPAKRGQSGGGD